jgi:hypothetical protein
MAMSADAVAFMRAQRFSDTGTIMKITKDDIKELKDLARRSRWIPQPNPPDGQDPQLVRTNPIDFSIVSFNRLEMFSKGFQYYDAVGRAETAALVRLDMMKMISDQFKFLKNKKAGELPIFGKNETPSAFIRKFRMYLGTCRSARDVPVPLSYVIRTDETVPNAPALAPGMPYSTEHGSVIEEMIARVSFNDALYANDNATVMEKFFEALANSPLRAGVRSFERAKDGRGAILAFIAQHCGLAQHEANVREAQATMLNLVYTGLDPTKGIAWLAGKHRTAFAALQEAVAHGVSYQLPNEATRTRELVNAIQTKDAVLLTKKSEVQNQSFGYTEDFEKTVAKLLEGCPVARLSKEERNKKKRSANQISETTAAAAAPARGTAATDKKVVGKSGVEKRYHQPEEYKNLTWKQRKELRRLRAASESGKPDSARSSGMNKKDVKAMIESVLHGMQKETAAAVEAKSQNATFYQSLIADLAAYTKTKEKPKSAPPGFSVEALLKKHASDK